jgi:hypothetical protein
MSIRIIPTDHVAASEDADMQPARRGEKLTIIPAEQFICTCAAEIRYPYMRTKLITPTHYGETRQRVGALCIHCRRHYTLVRTLRGGVWEIEADTCRQLSGKEYHKLLASMGPAADPNFAIAG